jgi:hypothetical protein
MKPYDKVSSLRGANTLLQGQHISGQDTLLIPWGALSDERTGLSFVCATDSCQRSLSRVLVPWDLQPNFTVSDLRLPFSSAPTTRRVTVEVSDPASTRVTLESITYPFFITRGKLNRDHNLSQFLCYSVSIRLYETCQLRSNALVSTSLSAAFRRCVTIYTCLMWGSNPRSQCLSG